MNNYTALFVICWVVAGLFSLAAILSFLDGAVLSGLLQVLGAVLFVATGFVVNTKRSGQHHADT
ncbi:hypothetical protein [Nesterenkonia sp. HG001]|uniref:hypothetical protein n=1 Tax=Nesterenkonia sp. HG001 TaxID=2983207 RepID=UPI002AC50670|nr:hypothetical protein [Nesterenkonia sp. HG001]MDZ5077437.1 hypothetical protein [Nesterenkonia sp. HG001]